MRIFSTGLNDTSRPYERFFEALGIMEDDTHLRTAPLYLKDFALIWWRWKCNERRRGDNAITTWGAFKAKLKAEFEPVNAKHEATVKLHRL